MLKSAFFSVLLRLSVPFFGLGNFLILVRFLSETEMGIWSLYLSVSTFLEVAKNGYVKNGTVRLINVLANKEHQVISSSFYLNSLISGVTIIGIFLFANPLSALWNYPDLGTMLTTYCIHVVLLIPFSHFEYLSIARMNFATVLYAYLARYGTLFVFIFSSLISGIDLSNLNTLIYFQIIGTSMGLIVLVINIKPRILNWKFDRKIFSELSSFGKYVFASNVISLIFRNTDIYMIATLISNPSVAYYSVAMRLTTLIDLPSTAAADVLFPHSVKEFQEKGKARLKELYEKVVVFTLAFVAPLVVVLFLFAEEIILLMAGNKYESSIILLKMTLSFGLFLPFLKQYGTIMNAINEPHTNFQVMALLSVVNIVANYFYITFFGLIGAALGTLTTYVVGLFLTQIILHKKIGVSWLSMINQFGQVYPMIWKKINDIFKLNFK